eukprot:1608669-Pleurochrysis_carterae.AAC.1
MCIRDSDSTMRRASESEEARAHERKAVLAEKSGHASGMTCKMPVMSESSSARSAPLLDCSISSRSACKIVEGCRRLRV